MVVGIDVGGIRKGFHAAALRDGRYLDKFKAVDPEQVLSWCEEVNAAVIGIDAPCRWGGDCKGRTRGRKCEHELAQDRISCFATPGQERASSNRFYGWMINGALLYQVLGSRYPLYCGHELTGSVCFETFPHAVACALAGHIVPARQKRIVRRVIAQGRGGYDRAREH